MGNSIRNGEDFHSVFGVLLAVNYLLLAGGKPLFASLQGVALSSLKGKVSQIMSIQF